MRLAESDIMTLIIISSFTKFDKLRFVGILKPDFSTLVEATKYVAEVCHKFRVLKVI